MVDRSTNATSNTPHRSHAVAGWSQAAGTPQDPTTPYLLATPQALRNSARCAATGQPETGLDNKP